MLQQPLDTLAEQTHRLIGPALMLEHRFTAEFARATDSSGRTSVLIRDEVGCPADLQAWRDKGVLVETVSLEDLFIEVTQ